ncbi:MAG TPA: serine/threonine-protein kinase [Bryobacteraceae bacterium]|nr:serine/threonine-protein kinase [Bryobacteraceae bacterium]
MLDGTDGGVDYQINTSMATPGNPSERRTAPTDAERLSETETVGVEAITTGSMLGHYQLLEPIGQGGMGQVWLAEQKHPVRRRVAVKLIKAGMDTREVIARFESERQALALMNHPVIAKIFDAGSTPQGRPYFVMEYVSGMPITTWCDEHRLTVPERLGLFMRVCEGVQHAHQKAIIHRDLKPSNILVSEVDHQPTPRIIDFGIARATAQRLTAATLYTRAGSLIGTPEYMSPEQANSAGEDIDTRSDVYSLGVVLYELLVGDLPVRFDRVPMEEIPSRLRDGDTPRPSSKLKSRTAGSLETAEKRGVDAGRLLRSVRGELDAITLKALEKDRARRYASAAELAADIGRWLRNEPVQARPATVSYRARKYVRRHRMGVLVAATAVVLAASFSIWQAVQLHRITRERDRANRVTAFLTDMFNMSDPGNARGNNVTVREVLDRSSKEIETGLSQEPEVRAELMNVMGSVYNRLGFYTRAEALLRKSEQTYERIRGAEDPATLRAANNLAVSLFNEGRDREAMELNRRVLEARRRVLGERNPDTAASMDNLAGDLSALGRFAEAERLERDALRIETTLAGADAPGAIITMNNLAHEIYRQGRYREAESVARDALEREARVFGSDHPFRFQTLSILAYCAGAEGRPAERERLLREELDGQMRVLGPGHDSTVATALDVVAIDMMQKNYAAAEKLYRTVLPVLNARSPEENRTAEARYNLACALVQQNKNRAEALTLLRDAIDHGLTADEDLGLEGDSDLRPLHGDPGFTALVAHARDRAAQLHRAK